MTSVHGDASVPAFTTASTWDVQNRQMAALYLEAAARAEDACARELLRRRAAHLILPRPLGRYGPLPY